MGVLGTFSESDFLMVWAIFKGLGPSAKSRAPNLYLKISICFVLCTRPTIIILDQYIREKMGSSYPVFKWHSITGLLSHLQVNSKLLFTSHHTKAYILDMDISHNYLIIRLFRYSDPHMFKGDTKLAEKFFSIRRSVFGPQTQREVDLALHSKFMK